MATLKDVKHINQYSEYLVYGYNRRIQAILPNNKSYYNIPTLVIHWIMLYFANPEHFATFAEHLWEIDDDKIKLIRNDEGNDATAYGNILIDINIKQIFEWTFYIHDCFINGSIGISPADCEYIEDDFIYDDHSCVYTGSGYIYYNGERGERFDQLYFGMKFLIYFLKFQKYQKYLKNLKIKTRSKTIR